jgi:hypothetical protein
MSNLTVKLAGIDVVGPGPGYLHMFVDQASFTTIRLHLVQSGNVFAVDVPDDGPVSAIVRQAKVERDSIYSEARTLTSEQIEWVEAVRPILLKVRDGDVEAEIKTETADQL